MNQRCVLAEAEWNVIANVTGIPVSTDTAEYDVTTSWTMSARELVEYVLCNQECIGEVQETTSHVGDPNHWVTCFGIGRRLVQRIDYRGDLVEPMGRPRIRKISSGFTDRKSGG